MLGLWEGVLGIFGLRVGIFGLRVGTLGKKRKSGVVCTGKKPDVGLWEAGFWVGGLG